MNLFDPPEFRTERLVLAPIVGRDASDAERVFADGPRVTQFVSWRPLADVGFARKFVEREARAWRDEEECRGWLARRADSGEVIGSAIARRSAGSAELSYVITRAHWGRGYATEIVRSILARARRDDLLREVWAACDAENVASRRVLEKAGMRLDSSLPMHQMHGAATGPRDHVRYMLPVCARDVDPA